MFAVDGSDRLIGVEGACLVSGILLEYTDSYS